MKLLYAYDDQPEHPNTSYCSNFEAPHILAQGMSTTVRADCVVNLKHSSRHFFLVRLLLYCFMVKIFGYCVIVAFPSSTPTHVFDFMHI